MARPRRSRITCDNGISPPELFQRPHAAALPCGMQHLGHSCLDAFMGIGDHQLNAAQAPPSELAQELRPEGLGFGWSDVHAKHFAPAVAVDADRDDHRNRHNAPALAYLPRSEE